ncbi:hypothetical protein Misp01_35170 [Microtetraspora sp. NBRC 13810]|uniref:hypothetical protein n=1 Tax=Microtetraspora sp. NBRC 13810 TaxID=3030990 RepID=UPI00249F9CA5|nr:hypothetical protein [Microtetraspora sp. NBRC 13810]GLW08387.1 hypothetical protein Misp01_35170 [Microtetraspora sp. NBRC 13810]
MAAERALSEDEPEKAYEHAKVARRFAARIGVVREAAGVTAYRAGEYAEALSDLRAARRMTGSDAYLPIMADCERGLGRPERALDLVRSPEAERLDRAGAIELAMVESGARRDLGQHDAAVVTLQRLPELRDSRPHPWSARLAFAYADALADAGHEAAATEWFGRAMAFDEEGETEAAERYAELTGEVIEDLEEDYEDDEDTEDIEDAEDAGDAEGESEDGEVAAADDQDDEADLPGDRGDEDLDDLAALDAQIEDEDDLDEEDFAPSAAEDGAAPRYVNPDDQAVRDTSDDPGSRVTPAGETSDAGSESDEPDDSGDEVAEDVDAASGDGSAEQAGEPAGTAEAASGGKGAKVTETVDAEPGGTEVAGQVADAEAPGKAAEAAAAGGEKAGKERKTVPGVGPAFIEPDFGDVLDGPEDSDERKS